MGNSKKLTRRDFIRLASYASAAIPVALSGFPLFANKKPDEFTFTAENENILVLIQLQGGNDGLNTVFNANQYDNLQAVRSNIIIPQAEVISLENDYGLHPAMAGMKNIWSQENLGIMQNVGYPNQNRSHFRSTDIWHSASDSDKYEASGWIGRYFDINNPEFPKGYPNSENPHPFAITIGKIVSETCQGTSSNFSLALADPENPGTALVSNSGTIPNNCYGDALTFVNETISQTNAYAEIITTAASSGNNLSAKYETAGNTKLAEKLKNVAKLISGGLQTKVYIVEHGGFDTHDNQVVDGDAKNGEHNELLKELSEAIEAFQDDLKLLNIEDKVVGMTYSEFGRRIRSNAALGTDHGNAAPLFLFGKCVNNQVLGDAPEIDTQVDGNEGVQMQFDFRNIYSTILTDWLGATKTESSTVLFKDFDALPLFKAGCSAALSTDNFSLDDELLLNVYPNPSSDFVTISFIGNNERTKISLFNSIGAVVKEISYERFASEKQAVLVDLRNLSRGTYFVFFNSAGITKTKKLIKN